MSGKKAVFLSYASEDAVAAQRLCDALREAGVTVWFDKEELRGGDAWDSSIRQQIRDCSLFVPVISSNTEARVEGYFRREWSLAADRMLDIAEGHAFLLPVVLDGMREKDAKVPAKFRDVHWIPVSAGEAPAAFVGHVRRLLGGAEPGAVREERVRVPPAAAQAVRPRGSRKILAGALIVLLAIGASAWYVLRGAGGASPEKSPAEPTSFRPPPHSIAVLPFVNLSGDPAQDYFSDGLTEELLNSLARIDELQVAARTSAFAFKGKDADIQTIARKLHVGAILEGSVRRSGQTVRITAQLVNAVTGFHQWSETYDRRLGDVLKLQGEIAASVAGEMKVALLGDAARRIALGGTHNPDAFDAFLHASRIFSSSSEDRDFQAAIDAYTRAIRLDSGYALAFAGRSRTWSQYAGMVARQTTEGRDRQLQQAREDARQAIALAPDLPDGHLAMGQYFEDGAVDFSRANAEYERAWELAPGDSAVLRSHGYFLVRMGQFEEGLRALRHAVELDPLARASHRLLADGLFDSRQFEAAAAAFQDTLAIDPSDPFAMAMRGISQYMLGNYDAARQACAGGRDYWAIHQCLALANHRLGRTEDAREALDRLQAEGDTVAYQFAQIFAQWGETDRALMWLEKSLRLRDPGLYSTRVDPLLDPLRKEPRFRAVEQALKLPN